MSVYIGRVSLVGNTTELTREWNAMLENLVENRDVGAFLEATDTRIRNDVKDLFTGKTFNVSRFRSSACLTQAVEICFLAHGMGPEALQRLISPVGEDDGRTGGAAFWRWCLKDKCRPLHNFVQAFKLNAGNTRNLAYSFEMFYLLWKRLPNDRARARYLNLAIACALVCPAVAQSPGLMRSPRTPLLTIPELYDYYVDMDVKHKLLTDVKKLSVTDLLLVVDARLTKSEFEWAMKNMKYKREEWGKSYESVEYVMERATQGDDLYDRYTFAEIKKLGGVCRDRAYYAAGTAKCLGIPATYVSGDGARGPHAWVNILTSDKSGWTGAGSYGYKTGRYVNPCSGRMQHESMLLGRDRKLTPEKLEPAATLMLFADYLRMLGCGSEACSVARQACNSFNTFTPVWVCYLEMMESLHEKEPIAISEWKRLQAELMRYGAKNTELMDLAQEVQTGYVLADASDATKKSMLRNTSRQLKKQAEDGRSDLLVESIRRQAAIFAEGGDMRGLAAFYRQQYKQYAGRGDVFGLLLSQHISFIEKINDKALYKQVAKDAEHAFSKNVYKGDDYFKVKKDAEVMGMIAELYRLCGEVKKADRIDAERKKVVRESARRAENS